MKLISQEELCSRAKKIKWFFCDIDGTLTDGGVYYSPDGELLKKFSLRDGMGFNLLKQCGIKTGIITGENSSVVQQRANKLMIDKYIFGTKQKLDALRTFVEEEGITLDNIAFIGDDLNDLRLIESCGLSFAVGDANRFVKEAALIICHNNGGNGAFREAVEEFLLLNSISINDLIDRL